MKLTNESPIVKCKFSSDIQSILLLASHKKAQLKDPH